MPYHFILIVFLGMHCILEYIVEYTMYHSISFPADTWRNDYVIYHIIIKRRFDAVLT